MENTLITEVITTKKGYMGIVKCFNSDNTKLWLLRTNIARLSKSQAMADAIVLKRDVQSTNKIFGVESTAV